MSQYGNPMPPPGPYVPPPQSQPNPGQQAYNPQQQGYPPGTPNYGVPGQHQKPSGTFGQMMNQAITTSKPMFNKLGKTINSKLGTKPQPGTPEHLQNYTNYQQHHQVPGYAQQQGQSFSPQPQQQQQQQWGQPQQQQQQPLAPNLYASPSQQSPYTQSTYATPASGHSGQSNYFPQQQAQPPNPQSPTPTPQQIPNMSNTFNTAHFEQSGLTMEQYMQGQMGQQPQGSAMQAQPQAPPQQEQYNTQQNQYNAQQTGIVGNAQQHAQVQAMQSPQMSNVTPEYQGQPHQPQWGNPQQGQNQVPPYGHQQTVSPPPPSQPLQTPPSVQQQQQQQQQQPQPQQPQQSQWNNMTPVSPQAPQSQGQQQLPPHSISPPPQQATNVPPQAPVSNVNDPNQQPSPAPQQHVPQAAPTEFIAELPADMGSLSIMESKPKEQQQPAPASQYQAYQPSGSKAGSPSPNFTIPRRSVSTSTLPLADPWRYADPVTETPTREFLILADLLFDALDRKFEPKNTGMLEATKVIGSWVRLSEDARKLFSYKSYSTIGKMWSLEGIPHFMVPCQTDMNPNWNFSSQSHLQDLKLPTTVPSATTTYQSYMPALNRAGWYKFLFLELCHNPDELAELIATFCTETYKPGVLNHPDLNKRDQSEAGSPLQKRAAEIETHCIERVIGETRSAMLVDPDVPLTRGQANPADGSAQASNGEMSAGEMAVKMHQIQAERNFNDTAVRTVLGGGIMFGGSGYSGGYGSLV